MFINALSGLFGLAEQNSSVSPTYVGNGAMTMLYTGNVPYPADVVENDLLFMICPTNTLTPSGWTNITTTQTNWKLLYRIATSSEPSSVNVTGSGLVRSRSHVIAAFRNYSSYSVLSSTVNDVFVGGTTTVDNCMVAFMSYASGDTNNAALASFTNADLNSINIRLNQRSSLSDGGGSVIITSTKISAGSFVNSTISKASPTGIFLPFTIIIQPL